MSNRPKTVTIDSETRYRLSITYRPAPDLDTIVIEETFNRQPEITQDGGMIFIEVGEEEDSREVIYVIPPDVKAIIKCLRVE